MFSRTYILALVTGLELPLISETLFTFKKPHGLVAKNDSSQAHSLGARRWLPMPLSRTLGGRLSHATTNHSVWFYATASLRVCSLMPTIAHLLEPVMAGWQAKRESLPLYRFHPDAYECSRTACLSLLQTHVYFSSLCFAMPCLVSSRFYS